MCIFSKTCNPCSAPHFLFNIRFVRRLMYFYKPSSKLYANLELDYAKSKQLTVVGCQFTEFLLESEEVRECLSVIKLVASCVSALLWERILQVLKDLADNWVCRV